MRCDICGWELREVFWDENVTPNRPLCSHCFEETICKCGQIIHSDGLCIDCWGDAQCVANVN